MVKQGDIIKLDFAPTKGHEQSGYRPAVVISNNYFNKLTGIRIMCPITNTKNSFPLHIDLDDRTVTKGTILCDQVKSIDINARPYYYVENIPKDILDKVIDTVFAEIEIVE